MKPKVYAFSETSFRNEKQKMFKFDRTGVNPLYRHVYASYDGVHNLNNGSKSKLAYDLLIKDQGNINLRFKVDDVEETDDKVAEEPVIQPQDITITVNGQSVVLSGKPDYIVVDLFQFYPFDLTMVRGNLVFLHNGNDADYSSPLNDGDVIELRWEDK